MQDAQLFLDVSWPAGEAVTALVREARRRVGSFTCGSSPHSIGVCDAGADDIQLFMALAREAERRVGNVDPQERANTAWAFATLEQPTRSCSRRWQEQQGAAWAASNRRSSPHSTGV